MEKKKEFAILLICVSIIILIFIYLIGSNISQYRDTEKLPAENIKKLYPKIKNGDLIFLSGLTRNEKICKWFSNSRFSHVGILFRDENDDVYILESDVGQNLKEGVRIQLLKNKLKKYKGEIVLGYRPINKEIDYSLIENIFNNDTHLDFDFWMLDWVLSPLKIGGLFKNKNTVFCSEYVHSVLKKCNVISGDRPSYEVSPKFFINCKSLDNGYEYGKLKYYYF